MKADDQSLGAVPVPGTELVPASSTSVVPADQSLPAVVERATVVTVGATRLMGRALGTMARRITGAPEPVTADALPTQGPEVLRVVALGLALDASRLAVDAAASVADLGRGFARGAGLDRRLADYHPPSWGPIATWYRRGAEQWLGAPQQAGDVLRGSAQDAIDSAVGSIDLGAVVARTDLVAVVDGIDIEEVLTALLDRLALDELVGQLLGRIDLNPLVDTLLDSIDIEPIIGKLLENIDMAELAEQAGIREIVLSSTRTISSSGAEFVRGQGVSADDRVDLIVDRILRRRRVADDEAQP